MGGLWEKLWWRTLCVWGFVFGLGATAVFAIVYLPVLLTPHRGVLDFAGGAVVHIGPGPFSLVLPWLAVEAFNRGRERPVPFGSYAVFAIVFAVTEALTGWMLYVPGGQPERLPFLILVYMAACGAGLGAGWAYARMMRRRPASEGAS